MPSPTRRRILFMNNKGQEHSREVRIRGLLDGFLRLGVASGKFPESEHVDGDAMSAFIEGNLSERESSPVVSHLVDCSFCRHRTAELIRLDLAFADEPVPETVAGPEPARVSEVLGGILDRIFGSGEKEVFAHQEKEEEEEDAGKGDTDERS